MVIPDEDGVKENLCTKIAPPHYTCNQCQIWREGHKREVQQTGTGLVVLLSVGGGSVAGQPEQLEKKEGTPSKSLC